MMLLVIWIPLLCAAIVGIVYAWIATIGDAREEQFVRWRRTTAWINLVAATAQLVLLAALFTYVDRASSKDPSVAAQAWTLMQLDVLVSVIAFGTALTRTGRIRWWMVFATIVLFGFTANMYVVTGIVF